MLKSLIQKYLNLPITENISPSLMKTFGVFGMINFPLLYILGASLLSEKPIALYLRLIGFIFCLFLALFDFWPKKLKRYQEFYWFMAITYSLPFFGTYMFIVNNASLAWQVKITVGIFWLVLITNWAQFLIILPLGMILAFLTFSFISGPIHLEMNNMWGDLLNCGWAIVIASIFARRKELTQKEKQQSLKMQAGAIAHEMRTPLSAIDAIAGGLKLHLPTLIHTQKMVQEKDQSIPRIHKNALQSLSEAPDELKVISRSAFTVVDMLLTNLKEDVPENTSEKCSILQCVETSLDEYSLRDSDKKLISVEIKDDFKFYGNSLMIKHVLFNLLKNALHYLKAANKGKITIWTETGSKVNRLYFEDTGKGIPKDYLPHIFNQFFTRTAFGSGVGLAFCKMVMTKLGGDITCESVEGDYTRFILTFPTLTEDKLP